MIKVNSYKFYFNAQTEKSSFKAAKCRKIRKIFFQTKPRAQITFRWVNTIKQQFTSLPSFVFISPKPSDKWFAEVSTRISSPRTGILPPSMAPGSDFCTPFIIFAWLQCTYLPNSSIIIVFVPVVLEVLRSTSAQCDDKILKSIRSIRLKNMYNLGAKMLGNPS